MKFRKYRDFQGRVLLVSVSGGKFMTVYHRPGCIGVHRVKSKFLPLRDTRDLAQQDLDRFARLRELEEIHD
jgi:hypothetical protein